MFLRDCLHLRKRFAFCLSVSGFTNPPIGQALAFDALEGVVAAGDVVDPACAAAVVAEIELDEIAVQMLLGAVLIDAALEDRRVFFSMA